MTHHALAPLLPALTLGWRPFIDPLDLHAAWWVLLLPIALGISIVYKAIRLETLRHYWKHVGVMTTQIVGSMILLAVAVHLVVEVYVRFIAAW